MNPKPNGELVPLGGGDAIPLSRTPLTVGRRDSCDVCLPFSNISGQHAELTFVKGFWVIRDLNSTNGTRINDIRLDMGAKKVLHSADVVTLGQRTFTLRYEETGKASDLAEFEEEIESVFNTPLLEKAGLIHEPHDDE